jgi:hypothetical protein
VAFVSFCALFAGEGHQLFTRRLLFFAGDKFGRFNRIDQQFQLRKLKLPVREVILGLSSLET